MSGKGSRRRKAAISEEQLAQNWDAIFGRRDRPSANLDEQRRQAARDQAAEWDVDPEWAESPIADVLKDSQSSHQ
jgi:hypothetical protein